MSFDELNSFLSGSQILKDQQSLDHYGQDWIGLFKPKPSLIVFPKTTKDLVCLVRWARKHKIGLTPSGGRTGLSGGATAVNKEVVVSFEKMNRIIEFNEFEETLTVEPGVITKEVQKTAELKGLFMPISFSAEGSSQIGGNIATNAGGIHVIRYGLTRNWVRGLKVVTGKGEILHLGRGLIKDAAGYSLLNLFIGSEGTLGFIASACLALTKKPGPLNVLLLGIKSLDDLIEVYCDFKKNVSLQAFEMFTHEALESVEKLGRHTCPLSKKSPFYALIEITEDNQEKALSVFERLIEGKKIEDGAISSSFEQAQNIWALRENISEAISSHKPYKNDISVRVSKLSSFLHQMESILKEKYPLYKVVWFGHIGDGNLHINIIKSESTPREQFLKDCQKVSQILFSKVKEFEGSISAEHGVGLLKKNALHYSRSKEEIDYMKALKKVFDPDGIMNPGKIF